MFSGPPMPRPNATSTSASVMSTPPVSASSRPTIAATRDQSCTVTETRSTGAADPVPSAANIAAIRSDSVLFEDSRSARL